MSNRSLELAIAAFLFVLGMAIMVGALGLGVWSPIGPASGSFPMAGGLLLTGLSAVNFVRALRLEVGPGKLRGRDALSIAGVVAAIAVYLGVVDFLGMFLPLPFLLVLLSLCVTWRTDPKWLLSMFAGAVVFSIGCYFVFKVFLRMLIAPGPFGF
jgi:hypothetical protein